MTVVKYSPTIKTVKEIYIKTYCFLLIPSRCKTRSSLIQIFSRFSSWKSFLRQFCSMTRIFIVKIFETVVRLSEVLAHTKKLLVCYVTNVSIQAFVEGLLRLANVLKATHWTLQTVNNICTLAIYSTNIFFCFPVTLLVYDDKCCICLQHL